MAVMCAVVCVYVYVSVSPACPQKAWLCATGVHACPCTATCPARSDLLCWWVVQVWPHATELVLCSVQYGRGYCPQHAQIYQGEVWGEGCRVHTWGFRAW
jgi:hypothetical protein